MKRHGTLNRGIHAMKLKLILFAAVLFGALIAGYSAIDPGPEPDAVLADGSRYFGELRDGLLHGNGRLEWPNGARYEGEFAGGMLSGDGRLVEPNGDVYAGGFRAGMLHGRGRIKQTGGAVYEGRFERDEIVEGRYTDTDGTHYEGDFRFWKYHGQGRLKLPSGEVYSGRFEDWLLVEGRVEFPEGGHFEGRFEDWMPAVEGVMVDADGNRWAGAFEYGMPHGTGEYHGADGRRYAGEFEHGEFHGEGVLRLPDGERYEGEFRWGMRHGQGTRIPGDGGEPVSGEWAYDKPAGEQGSDPYRTASAAVEAVLYNQQELLGAALDAIEPNRPDAIDLYLLAIAGDGSQEVFRREVEFVEELFARDFDTAGRSLSLINSRTTWDQAPLATSISIERGLDTLADRMNRDQDILFLFLTSHGSRNHWLTLGQSGLELPNLDAERLAALLKDSGIRWKILVISACYSGGFIDALADEHTLIITAASADRTSFGCTDDADLTYFGRAYFHDSLQENQDFYRAFEQATERVRELEQEQGYSQHSNPQIHAPTPILEQLERWQAGRAQSMAMQ